MRTIGTHDPADFVGAARRLAQLVGQQVRAQLWSTEAAPADSTWCERPAAHFSGTLCDNGLELDETDRAIVLGFDNEDSAEVWIWEKQFEKAAITLPGDLGSWDTGGICIVYSRLRISIRGERPWRPSPLTDAKAQLLIAGAFDPSEPEATDAWVPWFT